MRGKSKLKDHLDDIAKRHPEIADQLRDWAEVEKSPKIARGNSQEGPNVVRQASTEYQHKAAPQPQGSGEGVDLGQGPSKVHNLRNTVPDMQAQQEKMDQRNQRSQSAPPESVPGKGPSSNFDPNATHQGPVNFNSQQTHNQNRDQTQEQSYPQTQARSNERYIPIFVEDRGETIVNVPNEKGAQGQSSPPLRKKKSFPTSQSSGFQQSGQQQQQQQHLPPKSMPQAQPMPAPPASSPAPTAAQPSHHNNTDPSETDSTSQTPPPPPRPPSPLTLVANIQKEVEELKQRVDTFKGAKTDKEYIYLDEMLTRNLLKLDNIDSEGKDEVRAARKEVIKLIQQCINHLESLHSSDPVN